jgi:hypothetical protein
MVNSEACCANWWGWVRPCGKRHKIIISPPLYCSPYGRYLLANENHQPDIFSLKYILAVDKIHLTLTDIKNFQVHTPIWQLTYCSRWCQGRGREDAPAPRPARPEPICYWQWQSGTVGCPVAIGHRGAGSRQFFTGAEHQVSTSCRSRMTACASLRTSNFGVS